MKYGYPRYEVIHIKKNLCIPTSGVFNLGLVTST